MQMRGPLLWIESWPSVRLSSDLRHSRQPHPLPRQQCNPTLQFHRQSRVRARLCSCPNTSQSSGAPKRSTSSSSPRGIQPEQYTLHFPLHISDACFNTHRRISQSSPPWANARRRGSYRKRSICATSCSSSQWLGDLTSQARLIELLQLDANARRMRHTEYLACQSLRRLDLRGLQMD